MRRPMLILLALLSTAALADEAVRPLERAHSHNDYTRTRPLLDALDQGFCGVEADIHLVDGALLVAHDRDECQPDNTLEKLYLDPLKARVEKNGGRVYPDGPTLTLLIDFKTSARQTWPVLKEKLIPYHSMLTKFTDTTTEPAAVTIIISGSMPRRQVDAEPVRWVAIDGRLPDLKKNINVHLVPLISSSWTSDFGWLGIGKMPEEEQTRLKEMVEQAHANGQRIRFWGLPGRALMWPTLYEAGVDLLNADDIEKLGEFLRKKQQP